MPDVPDQKVSGAIISRLREEATHAPRGGGRLKTLARLEEACDDIASGQARRLAAQIGEDAARFGTARRPRINASTVEYYVQLRRKVDLLANRLKSEWRGPHHKTITTDPDLSSYVRHRQSEALGFRKPRPVDTKASRIDDMVATISRDEWRQEVAFAIEDGRRAQVRYQILVSALHDIPGVDVGKLLSDAPREGRPTQEHVMGPLDPAERVRLRRLLERLSDPDLLADFGLVHDGRRIAMAIPPGTPLIERDELALLASLAGAVG